MDKQRKIIPHNLGVSHERANSPDHEGKPNLERVFQEAWNKENTARPGINSGYDVVQGLMREPINYEYDGPDQDNIKVWDSGLTPQQLIYEITEREQRIVATIMQWLGTNCGFAFLLDTLKKGGYQLEDEGQKKRHARFMKQLEEKRRQAKIANSRFTKIRKMGEVEELQRENESF